MRFMFTRLTASTLAIAATALFAALAGDRTDSGPGRVSGAEPMISRPEESRVLTGKERLGNKWMDEQRVDNCKVPVDKRGTKPRPDTCPHPPAE